MNILLLSRQTILTMTLLLITTLSIPLDNNFFAVDYPVLTTNLTLSPPNNHHLHKRFEPTSKTPAWEGTNGRDCDQGTCTHGMPPPKMDCKANSYYVGCNYFNLSRHKCYKAVDRFDDTTKYVGYTSRATAPVGVVAIGYNHGCTAIYECEDPRDYGDGIWGAELKEKYILLFLLIVPLSINNDLCLYQLSPYLAH